MAKIPTKKTLQTRPDPHQQVVTCNGVHEKDGVRWFYEGARATNVEALNIPAPHFVMSESGRKPWCNHQFPMTAPVVSEYAWLYFLEIATDPLINAMMPIPHENRLYWVDDDGSGRIPQLLAMLALMSSPIYPVVEDIDRVKLDQVFRKLGETNVQPTVLTGCHYDKWKTLHLLEKETKRGARTLIVTGDADTPVPPAYQKIQPRELLERDPIELAQLSWPQLGCSVLKKYLGHNWPPKRLREGGYEWVTPKVGNRDA